MDAKVRDIKQKLESLRKRRIHFEHTWDDIGEYIIPRRERFRVIDRIKGERYGRNIYDSTAVQSSQIACDGTQGHMVSPSFRWIALLMREWDEDPEVTGWLQDLADQMYLAFNDSNFYEAMNEFLMDGWTIGTACMYIEEHMERAQLSFRTIHPREIFLAEDTSGNVTTVYREFYLTAQQAVEYFGEYDPEAARAAEKTPHEDVKFIHAVYPRYNRDSSAEDAMNMPYASCYIDAERSILVRESGYKMLPYAVWRFRKNSDEEYGRAPAWDALRDVKVLNEMVKSALTMVQKAANPVRFVPEEKVNAWKFIPGAINGYKNQERGPFPYQENQQLPFLLEMINQLRESIKQHFWVDFWQLMANRQDQTKTATEVVELQNEKLAILTSTIGRFTNEALQPIVDNVFEIEMAAGRLPQPPDKVLEAGGQIDVDFIGPLNQAVKRLGSQGTQQALMQVIQLAQVDPNVLQRFKLDEAAVQVAKSYGMDADVIRTDEEMQQIAEAQQAQQQQMMQAQMQAEALKGANPNEAPQQGSVLSQIMGAQ